MKKLRNGFKPSEWKKGLLYWCCFAVAFIYWEMLIKAITGKMTGTGFYFLCFVPAQALFMTALAGWFREKWNRFLTPVLLLPLTVFYTVQVGYFRICGSLLSVSLMGMGGDAIGDFGWTTKGIMIKSIGYFALVWIPFFLAILVGLIKKIHQDRYSTALHLCAWIAVVPVWCLGILLLGMGGKLKASPYDAFTNPHTDTDTAAQKLGISVTSLVEAKSYFWDGEEPGEELEDVYAEVVEIDLGELEKDLLETVEPDAAEGSLEAESSQEEEGEEEEDTEQEPVRTVSYRIFEEIDFKALAEMTDDPQIETLCNYFAGNTGTTRNEYSGMFKDYNLVYICAEGFFGYAANEQITPTLYKLANNGIVLTNYYNSFKNTTTNGEYALSTSLWPDVSRDAHKGSTVGSFPQSADKYMPYGLGNVSASSGYKAYGYHNYDGFYYGRDQSHPNLGLQCKFRNAGMKFTSAWPASDLEMMEQSVDDYIDKKKFIAYYMTFSGHGPYDETNYICNKNLQEVTLLAQEAGLKYNDQALCYLAGQRELDKALEYLLNRLEEAGKLDNTLIVLAGDHYPYYAGAATHKSLTGEKRDDNFEMYHSTCILYNAGMEEPIYCDRCCSNVDILPTVLNLLDIPYDSRMIAGTDIFSSGFHKAVLYNKSFVTNLVKYNSTNGKAEWLIDVSKYPEEDLYQYVNAIALKIDQEYASSLDLMESDFYRFVWENSGLMQTEHQYEPMPAPQFYGDGMPGTWNEPDASGEE